MKKNTLILLLLSNVFLFTSVTVSIAQDAAATEEEAAPSFALSGSIDTYFHSSLGSKSTAPGTSFSNASGFSLGMANLIASYSGEKAGFTADLVFGPRGFDAVFMNAYTGQRIVNQMFAYYKLSDAVTLNLGQFNTFVGYEVISPTLNFHYSTSYMFSWGPFSHTGLRADFTFGEGMVAKLAIMNPTDFVEFNDANAYTLGGQIGYTNDGGGAWLNFIYGDQDGKLEDYDRGADGLSEGSTFQVDLTTGWNLSDAFYLGANATFRTVGAGEAIDTVTFEVVDATGDAKGFMGVALYPKYTLSDAFSIGLRGEYFAVNNGYIAPFSLDPTNGDGSVIAATLSANYKIDNLTIIPEIRIDSASEDSYLDKDSKASTSLTTFNLALVYKF